MGVGGSVWAWGVGVDVGDSVWMWGADKWAPHRDHWARRGLVVGSYFHDDAHVVSRSFTVRFAVCRLMGPEPQPSGTVRHSYLGRRGFGDSSRQCLLSLPDRTMAIESSHRLLVWLHWVTMPFVPLFSFRPPATDACRLHPDVPHIHHPPDTRIEVPIRRVSK